MVTYKIVIDNSLYRLKKVYNLYFFLLETEVDSYQTLGEAHQALRDKMGW